MNSSSRIIGVDESGKGDFFGPLVVSAFLADNIDTAFLKSIGVRDGKMISENKILDIDEQLRQDYAHSIVVISPAEYNKKYKKLKNLNKLLAEGHAQAIDTVLKKNSADLAISDKFGKLELIENALNKKKCSIKLHQIVRGERITQVAAASIIARATFLREMDKLSYKYKVKLPRGAAPIVDKAGRKIVEQYGVDILSSVSKLHFKNYHRVVNPVMF